MLDKSTLSLRRKILLGLFIIDAIYGLLLTTGGQGGFVIWLALNAIVIIPALSVWALARRRKRSETGSVVFRRKEREQRYGSTHMTLNGEEVKSYGEKMVADYFFKSNIRYQYEQPAWSRNGRRISRHDFYLQDFGVYVEYWGMADTEEQDAREEYVRSMKWKMANYHENGIKFISIYRENLSNLDWIFKAKLRDETGIDLNKM